MLNLESMVVNLPEDVLKRKWSGDFDGEIQLIDALLKKEMPQILRDRLLVERKMAQMLPVEFCHSRKHALEMIRERIPDFSESELDELELDRAVEYIYIKGEKYYLRSFLETLLKVNADFAARAGEKSGGKSQKLDETIAEMKQKGTLSYAIQLQGELKVDDSAFVKGAKMRVHMPIPQKCAQQDRISVNAASASIDKEDALQRTAYFERMSEQNLPFVVNYSYINTVHYVDPLSGKYPMHPIYPDVSAPTADDLSEQQPHIAFTPFLKELAQEIKGDETDPVKIAWKFYDYVTSKIRYSFMRPYFLIEHHAEYCALNGKGDCGIQAILFITLCRIAGIPARWQSGLAVDEKSAGCHDWAQFYTDAYGWLFCDPSYGGSAFRAGAEERRKFYFGNLDPFRMVANSRYQTDFTPSKQCDRHDPYDNQVGEVEIDGCGLLKSQYDMDYKTLRLEKLN